MQHPQEKVTSTAGPDWYAPEMKRAFDRMIDGVAIVTRDQSIMYCNQSCRVMLGMTTEQILGNEPLEPGTHAIDYNGQRLEHQYLPSQIVFRNGEPLFSFIMGIRREGDWDLWVDVNAIPIAGPGGEPIGGCLMTVRENTGQRLAEQQLRRHAEIFRRTSDGIVIIDREARISEWSDGAERLFGYSSEEVIGCYAWMLHDENELGERIAEMRKYLRRREDWKGEIPFRSKDGAFGVAEVELFPVTGPDRKLQEIQIIYHNVTAQREATEEARLRARYLEALADMSTSLLQTEEHLPALNSAVTILGRAAGASRCYVFENSYGPKGEWFATQVAEWCAQGVTPQIDNDDLQELPYDPHLLILKRDFERNEPHSALVRNEPEEFRGLLEDQDIKAILLIPITTHSRVMGFIGFDNCQNERLWSREQVTLLHAAASTLGQIYERWTTEEDREQLEEQLRQSYKMEALGRMSGGIAHDFNNILAAILGYTQDLSEVGGSNDDLQTGLSEIRKAAQRGARLIEQLLTFARRQVVEPRPLQLNEVVRDLQPMLKRLTGSEIEIANSLEEDLWEVLADPGQIEQILTNLTLNSRDAMSDSGTITIVTENVLLTPENMPSEFPLKPGEYVSIAVEDEGPGMPQDVLAKVFEPFFTTKETGKGTGIGLAVVYGIVQGNGGHIWPSNLEKGCRFTILLPRDGTNERISSDDGTELPASGVSLIIDPDSETRQIIGNLLHTRSYTVFLGANQDEGCGLMEDIGGRPDLLVVGTCCSTNCHSKVIEHAKELHSEVSIIIVDHHDKRDSLIAEFPDAVILSTPLRSAEFLRAVLRLSRTHNKE